MRRETTHFTTRAQWLEHRANFITSTEVAALFGRSPYMTFFELYHRHKHNQVLEIEPSERMKWGTRFEPAIAQGIAEERGWNIREMKEFISIPELRLGSSFDYRIVVGDKDSHEDGIFEIKNVSEQVFRESWTVHDDDIVEPPIHIVMQVQDELFCSGLNWAKIGVVVGGNTSYVVDAHANVNFQKILAKKVSEFWTMILTGHEPTPDFMRDAEYIKTLYQNVDQGKIVSADDQMTELAQNYNELGKMIKDLEAQRAGCKAHLLTLAGDAEKIIHPEFTINLGMTKESVVEAFTRKAFRNFRITERRKK